MTEGDHGEDLQSFESAKDLPYCPSTCFDICQPREAACASTSGIYCGILEMTICSLELVLKESKIVVKIGKNEERGEEKEEEEEGRENFYNWHILCQDCEAQLPGRSLLALSELLITMSR